MFFSRSYFALAVAFFILSIKLTWWAGQRSRTAALEASKVRISDLLHVDEAGVMRLATPGMDALDLGIAPGMGIYYHDSTELGIAPPVMVQLLHRCRMVHKVSLLVTVRVQPVPHVPLGKRILVRPVPGTPGCFQV